MEEKTIVRMENISITFPGVKALDHVNFDLRAGEVHVLLGENGAGKSTLMKILAGAYKKDEGTIYLNDEPVEINSPKHAMELGIRTIYQELNLIPYLTVAENIFLGCQSVKNGLISWKEMNRQAAEILDHVGVKIDPKAIAGDLGIAQKQMVEIAKAVYKNASIVIMDEPTSALTDSEISNLFRIIRELTAKGVGVIYISHRMQELNVVGDRVTVLRDGQYIKTVNFKDVTTAQLIKLMVGRELNEKFPKETVPQGDEVLRVKGICTADKLKNCDLTLHKGEILGIAGLMGSGRTELARAITGADRISSGEVFIDGKPTVIRKFKDSVKNGIAFLTEDRKNQGLVQPMDVKSNITLVSLEKLMQRGFINLKAEGRAAQEMVESIGIKTPGVAQLVRNLSGGNQQKVVLAKWLFADCKILIFDEPTRGIDVGAKTEIYALMNRLVKQGVGIIMISSELPEIIGMSDRVVVMHEGSIVGELLREEATQEKILEYAVGGKV